MMCKYTEQELLDDIKNLNTSDKNKAKLTKTAKRNYQQARILQQELKESFYDFGLNVLSWWVLLEVLSSLNII